MEKILGIIGGMGPLASVRLFEKIVLLSEAKSDQENLHIIIDNNTKIPDRTDYILGGGKDPRPQLIESAKRLEKAGADYLIMGCNTAHYFYQDLVKEIQIPFINMIEETLNYIIKNNKGIGKIGLLATSGSIESKIYHSYFSKHNIQLISPSKMGQEHMTKLMYNIKKGIYDNNLKNYYGVIDEIKSQQVDLFLLACTELSVAKDLYSLEGNYIDAMEILAKSAIEFSKID